MLFLRALSELRSTAVQLVGKLRLTLRLVRSCWRSPAQEWLETYKEDALARQATGAGAG